MIDGAFLLTIKRKCANYVFYIVCSVIVVLWTYMCRPVLYLLIQLL